VASVLDLLDIHFWVASPGVLGLSLFQLWMLIDAIRRQEWIWAVFIFLGFGFSAILY